jgi:hypothetical protein
MQRNDRKIMNEWTSNLKKTICKLHCKAKTIKTNKSVCSFCERKVADLAKRAARNEEKLNKRGKSQAEN